MPWAEAALTSMVLTPAPARTMSASVLARAIAPAFTSFERATTMLASSMAAGNSSAASVGLYSTVSPSPRNASRCASENASMISIFMGAAHEDGGPTGRQKTTIYTARCARSPAHHAFGALEILDGVDLAPAAVDERGPHDFARADEIVEQVRQIGDLELRRAPVRLAGEL